MTLAPDMSEVRNQWRSTTLCGSTMIVFGEEHRTVKDFISQRIHKRNEGAHTYRAVLHLIIWCRLFLFQRGSDTENTPRALHQFRSIGLDAAVAALSTTILKRTF